MGNYLKALASRRAGATLAIAAGGAAVWAAGYWGNGTEQGQV